MNEQMPNNQPHSQFLDFLKKSEEFCEKYDFSFRGFSRLVSKSSEKDRTYTHIEWLHSEDDYLDPEYDCEYQTALMDLADGPYFEEIKINEETNETAYYSFCYHENETEVSPIYRTILRYKPQAKIDEAYAELIAEFITIEEFNKFFENASFEKVDNFKSRKHCAPVFLDLLKTSEEYCKKNKLSTLNDLQTVCYARLKARESNEALSDKDRKKIIEVMKNAAFYEQRYNEELKDIEHYALAYYENCNNPVFALSLCENADDLDVDYYDVLTFTELMSRDNVTTDQMKCFKCFRDVK